MWAKFITIILGIWLMVAPSTLAYPPNAANNGYIIGPLIVTFSVIALWEATHAVQKWNYPLGGWLLLSPWALHYDAALATASDMAVGALVIILSSVQQKIRNRYGGGWAALWKDRPAHLETKEKEFPPR